MLEVGVAAIGDTGCRACPRLARAFYFYISIRRNLMKHKLWTVFLTALVALCLVVGFAACDNGMGDGADDPIVTPMPDDEDSAAHEHNYGVWQAERAATCTADGLQVRVCQTCGHEETQTLSMLGHDIVYHAGQAATCTLEGWEAYETCSRCDYTTYVTIPELGHDIVYHAGQAATCTQEGWEAYEACSRCDYTTYQSIPELGHDIIEHAGQAATCTQAGWEAYETCSRCNYTTYQSISELGHDIIEHAGQAVTCTQAGWEAYETCSRCDYTTYAAIPEAGHRLVPHAGQDPTCTQSGWAAYETCENCDYTTYQALSSLGHHYVNGACDRCGASDPSVSPEPDEQLVYRFNGSGYTITGIGTMSDAVLTIPSTYNGHPVTEIGGSAFAGITWLSDVTIPDSVTSIGDDIFEFCSSLNYNEYGNAYYLGNANNPYLILIDTKYTTIYDCNINSNTKFIYSNAFFHFIIYSFLIFNCLALDNSQFL